MKSIAKMLLTFCARTTLIFAVIACGFGNGTASAQNNVVNIVLTPEAMLDDTVVYLDQIAKLSGGPISLRQRIARLDVAEFKLHTERTTVSGDQVKFRLLLAGIGAAQFRVSGAQRTLVLASDEPIAARTILAAADKAMRSRYPSVGAPKDVIAPLMRLELADRVEFDARIPISAPRTGAARVDVIILVNGKPRESVPVNFDVDARSTPLKTSPFQLESRPAFRPEMPKEKSEFLIKTRDLVKIVAVVGSAHIEATGEAQQDGRLGEIIRVKNVESNRTVNGRIESRGIVLVDY
jgi:hypothetical protein